MPKLILPWFVTISLIIINSQADPLKISVYYESLCPDCIRFIVEQVYPTYQTLSTEIVLDLIAFGKAKATYNNGTWNFTCQHGPRECYGNKVQSCAIALNDMEKSLKFVYCAMKSSDPSSENVLQGCSKSSGILWTSLKNCLISGDADKLLAINGQRTREVYPPLQFVPTVLFNNYYNQSLENEALSKLQQVVCDILDEKPEECNNNDIKLIVM